MMNEPERTQQEPSFGESSFRVTDTETLCLHTGFIRHEMRRYPGRWVRTSRSPVRGMIRREPGSQPFHFAVCLLCGAWAADLHRPPVIAPSVMASAEKEQEE